MSHATILPFNQYGCKTCPVALQFLTCVAHSVLENRSVLGLLLALGFGLR
jgi:hypothetical protein